MGSGAPQRLRVLLLARGFRLKAGYSHGETDRICWETVVNPVQWHDFCATMLHLIEEAHKKLNFSHNGIERSLTKVHVATGIFA